MKNDPIYADINFADIVNQGDSLHESNGYDDANDFFQDESTSNDLANPKPNETPARKPGADSVKAVMPSRPLIKVLDEKEKKNLPKPKSKPSNDY